MAKFMQIPVLDCTGFLGVKQAPILFHNSQMPLALPVCLWQNTNAMTRWVRFIIAVLIGIALGLLFGWVINPIEYTQTAPNTLRVDYQTDYVLMISEAFHTDGDMALAVHRLAVLGDKSPEGRALQAIIFAEQAGYIDADLDMMRNLSDELQIFQNVVETPEP